MKSIRVDVTFLVAMHWVNTWGNITKTERRGVEVRVLNTTVWLMGWAAGTINNIAKTTVKILMGDWDLFVRPLLSTIAGNSMLTTSMVIQIVTKRSAPQLFKRYVSVAMQSKHATTEIAIQ
jgi:hypothetical protein